MTKKIISEKIDYLQTYDFEGKVQSTIKMLTDIEKTWEAKGYSNIRIAVQPDYEYATIDLYGDRIETDREAEKRINKEKKEKQVKEKKAEIRKAKHLKILADLKAKYEKD